jgi:hypothetical protein
MYNALEWHNFIADTRAQAQAATRPAAGTLEELFDEVYGDEFWFEVAPYAKNVYQVAFDLRSEEFVICDSDTEVDFVMEMAADSGDEDEIFWAD